MPNYPNQPYARFSSGGNRRSEHDSASPKKTKEESTRSRTPRSTGHATKPIATATYLIEQVCIVNKELSNVVEKIAAIADTIQNARTPQMGRLLEEAISRAANNISKTAKMDTGAPTPDWSFFAERLLVARREALERELASATANLQMTRGEANSLTVSETARRNDLLNKEIEESLNTSSTSDTTPKKKVAEFESPFKQQSAKKNSGT